MYKDIYMYVNIYIYIYIYVYMYIYINIYIFIYELRHWLSIAGMSPQSHCGDEDDERTG